MKPFEFWPFNIPQGTAFLGVYLLLAFGALAMAVAVGQIALRRAGRERARAPREADVARGDPYRTLPGDTSEVGGIALGRIPRPDDFFTIAYMRGGVRAVAEALIANAISAGAISSVGRREFRLNTLRTNTRHADAFLAAIREDLASSTSVLKARELHAFALTAARALVPTLETRLESAGIGLKSRVKMMPWTVGIAGLLVLFIGLVRLLRAMVLLHDVGYLIAELFGLMLIFGIAFAWARRMEAPLRNSPEAKRYLVWLDSATDSLQSDVRSGRRAGPDEIGLAIAVGGAVALSSAPLFAGTHGVLFDLPYFSGAKLRLPAFPVTLCSTGRSGGSGCGSATCGGGGCGSSGCGGGGGGGGGCGG